MTSPFGAETWSFMLSLCRGLLKACCVIFGSAMIGLLGSEGKLLQTRSGVEQSSSWTSNLKYTKIIWAHLPACSAKYNALRVLFKLNAHVEAFNKTCVG